MEGLRREHHAHVIPLIKERQRFQEELRQDRLRHSLSEIPDNSLAKDRSLSLRSRGILLTTAWPNDGGHLLNQSWNLTEASGTKSPLEEDALNL